MPPVSASLIDKTTRLTECIAFIALGFISLATLSLTLFTLYKFPFEGPYFDTWLMLPLYKSFLLSGWSSITLEQMIEPHAGAHRVLLIRLITLADFEIFSGRNTLFYILSIGSQLIILLLFLLSEKKDSHENNLIRLTLIGIPLLFSQTLLYDFMTPINSSWFISTLLIVLSIYFCINYLEKRQPISIILTWIFAMLAGFGNFSGIVIWPVLLFILRKNAPRELIISFVFSAIYLFLYSRGLHTDTPESPNHLPQNWLTQAGMLLSYIKDTAINTTNFVIAYFGGPLSRNHPIISSLFSIPALIYLLFNLIQQVRFNNQRPFRVLCMATALAMLLVALSTAMGRSIFRDPAAERYQPVVMLFWFAISSLAFSHLSAKRRLTKKIYLSCFIFLFLIHTGSQQVSSIKKNAGWINKYNRSKLSAMMGLTSWSDNSGLINILMGGNYIAKYNSFLSEHKLGFYSIPTTYSALKHPTTALETQSKTQCYIRVIRAEIISQKHGLTYLSTAVDIENLHLDHQHWLFDNAGNIQGAISESYSAQNIMDIFSSSATISVNSHLQSTYINTDRPLYVYLDDGRRCNYIFDNPSLVRKPL